MTVCEHCKDYIDIIEKDLCGMVINLEQYYICYSCLKKLVKQREENE